VLLDAVRGRVDGPGTAGFRTGDFIIVANLEDCGGVGFARRLDARVGDWCRVLPLVCLLADCEALERDTCNVGAWAACRSGVLFVRVGVPF
jgi:hypothetical protein